VQVTDTHIKEYERNGAVHLPGLIAPHHVALLERGIDRNIREPSPRFKDFGAHSDRPGACIEDHWSWPHILEYVEFFQSSCIAETAGLILCCKEIRLLEDQYLQKAASSLTVSPWHQDQPFYAVSGPWISFWIALDRMAADDALEVVAGSHVSGRLYPSKSLAGGHSISPMPDQLPDHGHEPSDWKILRWPLEPGDAIAFHPFAIHGNSGNLAKSRARRFVARFASEDVVYRAPATSYTTLIPDHFLSDGERLHGPLFPLLWNRNSALNVV